MNVVVVPHHLITWRKRGRRCKRKKKKKSSSMFPTHIMKQLQHCRSQTHKRIQQSRTQVSVPPHSHHNLYLLRRPSTCRWCGTNSAQNQPKTDTQTKKWPQTASVMEQTHYSAKDAEIKYILKKQTDSTGGYRAGTRSGDTVGALLYVHHWHTHTHTFDDTLLGLVSEHATPLTSSLDS